MINKDNRVINQISIPLNPSKSIHLFHSPSFLLNDSGGK